MQTIKIFLASSSELREDREQFEIAIYRKCKTWLPEHNIFLHLDIWEDYIDAMSATRLQDEYNKAVLGCDIFVLLAYTKVGKYTEEEFTKVFSQFQTTNKPFIFTYFKEPIGDTSTKEPSVKVFQDKLNSLGHFHTVYKSIEDLQLQFVEKQLEKLRRAGFVKNEKEEMNNTPTKQYEQYAENIINVDTIHNFTLNSGKKN
jgi:hypothetical protein